MCYNLTKKTWSAKIPRRGGFPPDSWTIILKTTVNLWKYHDICSMGKKNENDYFFTQINYELCT